MKVIKILLEIWLWIFIILPLGVGLMMLIIGCIDDIFRKKA